MTVSIIGCVVNGPGEASMTQIGITGGGNNTHMVYINGKKNHRIKNEDLPSYLENIIRKEAAEQKNKIYMKIQPVRGTHDLYGEQLSKYRIIEKIVNK